MLKQKAKIVPVDVLYILNDESHTPIAIIVKIPSFYIYTTVNKCLI